MAETASHADDDIDYSGSVVDNGWVADGNGVTLNASTCSSMLVDALINVEADATKARRSTQWLPSETLVKNAAVDSNGQDNREPVKSRRPTQWIPPMCEPTTAAVHPRGFLASISPYAVVAALPFLDGIMASYLYTPFPLHVETMGHVSLTELGYLMETVSLSLGQSKFVACL